MPDDSLTRAELLRRAGVGAAGLAAVGGGAYALTRLLDDDAAGRVVAHRAAGQAARFVSRPELRPPKVSVLRHTGATGKGLLMLAPSSGPGDRGPLIVDNEGEVVWFRSTGRKITAMNLRAALYHGRPVLTWWEGDVSSDGLGRGEHVIVDNTYREIARFPVARGRGGDLHEFVLTPDGTALVTAWTKFTRNLLSLGGRRRHTVVDGIAQEIDPATGRLLFEWRARDHIALVESHAPLAPRFDYFHINSVGLAPDGDWIVSARNTWAIYKLSRKTGDVVWRLGGKQTDFAMGPGTQFAWQHDARALGDGSLVSLFDNGAAPAVEKQSRGLVVKLDQAQRRATLQRVYRHRPNRLLAHYMGSMQVLHNGNAVLGWGSDPYLTEFAEDGSIVFDARLPRAGQTYRALRMPWTGRPRTKPALAGRRVDGRLRLHASWNGATELAKWKVRTGSHPTRLHDVATVPKHGFETSIEVSGRASYAAVVALDSAGKPLATSATIRV